MRRQKTSMGLYHYISSMNLWPDQIGAAPQCQWPALIRMGILKRALPIMVPFKRVQLFVIIIFCIVLGRGGGGEERVEGEEEVLGKAARWDSLQKYAQSFKLSQILCKTS